MAGYEGAIASGNTTCGFLIGAVAFIGFYHGRDADDMPVIDNEKRRQAIRSVKNLFLGFVDRFGQTDCQILTGCDWRKKEDARRYYHEKIYLRVCMPQMEYVMRYLLQSNVDVSGSSVESHSI
jgi:hypothetical protein